MAHGRGGRLGAALASLVGALLLIWAVLAVVGVEPWDNQGPRNALICALVLAAAGLLAWTLMSRRRVAAAAEGRVQAAQIQARQAREQAEEQEREAHAGAEQEVARARERAQEHVAREREHAEVATEQAAQAERRADDHEARSGEHEARADEHARRAKHHEQRADRAERDADSHRHGTARAIAALQRERAWNRELRSQVVAMARARGALGRDDDVRALVLRVALELTESPKGLLLARSDDDGDGRLDVVAAEGFEADASHSELAQRFAERVLERDEVVREDAPGNSGAAVDGEIESLIAIPIWMADTFSGVVICADREGGFADCDDEVLLSLGDHAGSVMENAMLHGRLRDSFVATVRLLAEAIQAKDPFLRGHSEDVAEYVDAVSKQLGISPGEREQLAFASLLHDVGKIGISERILLKPGRLTPEERSVIELHPRIGFRLVEQVPGMEEIAPVILHHHERWDGAGYPARLRGEDIPLAARVICVADAFSAMTEQRPYRDRMSLDEACDELEKCAGSQFDPRVVGLFTTEVRDHPREGGRGPVAEALSDGELEARRTGEEGVLGAGTAALTDSLTLLYSHRYFHEAAASQAERAELQGSPFCVLMCELTGLPEINRTAGYASGDEALRACGRALSQAAVRHGAVACRVGGHRLGLLVGGVEPAIAGALAEELRQEMPGACEVRVAAATWTPGQSGDDVVADAQTALESAVDAR